MTLLNDVKLCESRLEAARQAAIEEATRHGIDPYKMQDNNGSFVMVPILTGLAQCYLARALIEQGRQAKKTTTR